MNLDDKITLDISSMAVMDVLYRAYPSHPNIRQPFPLNAFRIQRLDQIYGDNTLYLTTITAAISKLKELELVESGHLYAQETKKVLTALFAEGKIKGMDLGVRGATVSGLGFYLTEKGCEVYERIKLSGEVA